MNGASRWLDAEAPPARASSAAATMGAARKGVELSSRMSDLQVLLMGRLAFRGGRPEAVALRAGRGDTRREMLPDAKEPLTAFAPLACIHPGPVSVRAGHARSARGG